MVSNTLEHLRHWHLDIPTLVVTLVLAPIVISILGIVRRHGKAWAAFLVEGACYGLGRFVIHSLAARFTLKRYCRLQLKKENQYLFVPSRNDVKLEIDRVFVNLTLEHQSDNTSTYNQHTLFSAGNRIRVIGDPGSGKSSLVKRLFRDTCAAAIAKPSKAKLPILTELKTLVIPKTVTDQKLGDWFYSVLKEASKKSEVYRMDECFDNYARSSGLLLLLDGLDEVATSVYARVEAAVIALSEKLSNLNHENVIVLTMRTQLHQQIRDAFRNNFGKALFVKSFSPTDVYEFLSRWPFTDRQIGNAIYTELTDRPTLREMCTNPLVLAMYVAERQSGCDPITPESRTDFYRRVLEELLVKRRMRQIGQAPALGKLREQRQRILGKLAYDHMLDSGEPANSLRWEAAIQAVETVMSCDKKKAEEIFLEISKDTGLVSQERERESFRFIHLTFCEFLAAHEAVDGQKDGLERLVGAHERFRSESSLKASSRLLEAIPFACGLVQRARRGDAISAIADLADDQLLARCFLETKSYEHESWNTFVQRARDSLLSADESEWTETWLQDLHLFNVVVRDARQCSTHIPSSGTQIDLGEFYAQLVSRQGGKGLARLLAAYASHDAPAALRLADVSGLDLPRDFPEIIITNCDQAPFLSLVTGKMLSEPDRPEVWAAPLVEAALNSRLVARSLRNTALDRGSLGAIVAVIPSHLRWDILGLTSKSLYTQIVSLAVTSTALREYSRVYPRLYVLSRTPAPGSLALGRFFYTQAFMSGFSILFILILIAIPIVRDVLGITVRLSHPLYVALATAITALAFYGVAFKGLSTRIFYSVLLNLGHSSAVKYKSWFVFLVFPAISTSMLFLTESQRTVLSFMGREVPWAMPASTSDPLNPKVNSLL